jgi:hypothetical protein
MTRETCPGGKGFSDYLPRSLPSNSLLVTSTILVTTALRHRYIKSKNSDVSNGLDEASMSANSVQRHACRATIDISECTRDDR